MPISQLSLTDFRNLKSTTLDFNPDLNLITGANGSGKTSLLEAIHVLCQAGSFRTHQLKQCVRHGEAGFLLFGRFGDFKAGLSKSGKKTEIRINGEVVKRRSELVRKTPVQVVNSDSFDLITGPPQRRRRYIDWCLFHVEQEYADLWVDFQHALKQRNQLLRSRRDLQLLDYWDDHLARPAEQLSQMRAKIVAEITALINGPLNTLLQGLPVAIEYRPGWAEGQKLIESLASNRERDIRLGHTGAGIHRDELLLTVDTRPAAEVLSRGQSKRLCVALLLATLVRVDEVVPGRIILLVDDLNSELDSSAREVVLQRLLNMNLQLFISNISDVVPDFLEAKEFKMFHVEHGTIKPRNFS